MIVINLNSGNSEHYKFTLFPDNQPHVNVQIPPGEAVTVVCRMRSALDVLTLMCVSDALLRARVEDPKLVVPYLMGARYDREIKPGDSVDLIVIADLLNLTNFNDIVLFDAHNSEKSQDLISGARNVDNKILVDKYDAPNSVLICPDKGAKAKVDSYLEWNKNLTYVVYCEKSRDLETGKIALKVSEPDACLGNDCVIIDDLCDGGGTFLAIADQIKPKSLTLIVSHGIFSKGLNVFPGKFNHIIVSDSYSTPDRDYGGLKITVVSVTDYLVNQ